MLKTQLKHNYGVSVIDWGIEWPRSTRKLGRGVSLNRLHLKFLGNFYIKTFVSVRFSHFAV